VTKTAKVSISVSGVGLGLDHAGLGLGLGLPGLGLGLGLSGLGLGLPGLDNTSAKDKSLPSSLTMRRAITVLLIFLTTQTSNSIINLAYAYKICREAILY